MYERSLSNGALSLLEEHLFIDPVDGIFSDPAERHFYVIEDSSVISFEVSRIHVFDVEQDGGLTGRRLAEGGGPDIRATVPAMTPDGRFFYALSALEGDPPGSFLERIRRDPVTGLLLRDSLDGAVARAHGEDQLIVLDGGRLLLAPTSDSPLFRINAQNGDLTQLTSPVQEDVRNGAFLTSHDGQFLYLADATSIQVFLVNGGALGPVRAVPAVSAWSGLVMYLLLMLVAVWKLRRSGVLQRTL